jgi:hypothetical protein
MLRRVALVTTDVSEELSPSFITGTRISVLGTTLAGISNRRTLRTNTNIPEDAILHSHCHENLKSYTVFLYWEATHRHMRRFETLRAKRTKLLCALGRSSQRASVASSS